MGTFITNIGNGMYTLAVSKILYDRTGSVFAFGYVITLEYIISFLVQFLSGYIVDNKSPKKIAFICDFIRGILIIGAGMWIYNFPKGVIILTLITCLVNFINPFYKSANFKLIPLIKSESISLLKINGVITTLFQLGQLLGVALAGVILTFSSPAVAIIINGFTFIFSGIMISLVELKEKYIDNKLPQKILKQIFVQWKEVFFIINKNKSLVYHIVISSGDYISINFINLMLVPMVNKWYKENIYISVFDGAFAIGAMFSILLVIFVYKNLSFRGSCWIGLSYQSIGFLMLMISRNPFITTIIMVMFGLFNGSSVAILQTSLQERTSNDIKGKISSLRNFIIAVLSMILIPITSKLYDTHMIYGFVSFSIIIGIFALGSNFLGRTKYFEMTSYE